MRQIIFTAHRHIFDRGPRGRYHSTPRGRGVLVRVLFYKEEGLFASWGQADDRTDAESVSVVRRRDGLVLFGAGEAGGRVYLLCPPTVHLRGVGPIHRWERRGHWHRDILHGARYHSTEVLGYHYPQGCTPEGRGKHLSYDGGGKNPVTLTIPTLKGGNTPPRADQVTLLWEIW